MSSIEKLRKQSQEMGPLESLERKKRQIPPRRVIMDGKLQARLVAGACSKPPKGHAKWTLRLLGERLVELELVDSISPETVRSGLKKNELQPHLKRYWCISPKGSAAFVARMEDVLSVYARARDPKRPLVCVDEFSKQLLSHVREPVPMKEGQVEREDNEYVRKGTVSRESAD